MKKTLLIAALAVSIVHSAFAVTASREWSLMNFYTKSQVDDSIGPRIQTVEQTVGQLGQRAETIRSELAVATGRVLAVESAVSSRRSVSDLAVYTNAFSWSASGQSGQAVKSILDSNHISPVWDGQRSRWTIPATVGEYTVDWERLTGDESVTNREAEIIFFHNGGEIDVGYEDETGYHGSFHIESLVAEVNPVKSDDTILRKSEADGRFVQGEYDGQHWNISVVDSQEAENVFWGGVYGTPTTLSGYGITDAKIENGTITLGSQTITPLLNGDNISVGNVISSGVIESIQGIYKKDSVSGSSSEVVYGISTNGTDYDLHANVNLKPWGDSLVEQSKTIKDESQNLRYTITADDGRFYFTPTSAINPED